jgi:hypothetical protein
LITYHIANAAHTTPMNVTALTWTIPAPLLAVELALAAADVALAVEAAVLDAALSLGLPLCCAPVNATLSDEIANVVVVEAKVTPVPLTHSELPGAPSVKLTPAHWN